MDHIWLLGNLGNGDYGTVYKAYDQTLDSIVAVKIIWHGEGEEGQSSAFQELSCSNALPGHVNILSVKYSFQTKVDSETVSVLVFDLMAQDLFSYMEKRTLSLLEIKHFMRHILQGVVHCHQNKIVHRDLKLENLLLDGDMNVKLADFGLAYRMTGSQTLVSNVGPLLYNAPEQLLGSTSYSSEIDVWAVGCIFAELVTGQPLFDGEDDLDQLYKIFFQRGTPTEQTWRGVSSLPVYNSHAFPHVLPLEFSHNKDLHRIGAVGLDLLDRMLVVCPAARITAVNALNHPYFSYY